MNFVEIGDYTFPTVLALTDEEHARGLMFVREEPPVMSFIYSKASINKIWMKNTYIPLDVLFCRDGKIVSIANGIPHSEELLGPDSPTDIVIEMPAGSVEKFNISAGQQVKVTYDLRSLGKKVATQYFVG